jgi:hypothetical protein
VLPLALQKPAQCIEYGLRPLLFGVREHDVTAFGPAVRNCADFIALMEKATNLVRKWWLKLKPPTLSAKGHMSTPMTVSIHTLLVLYVPRLKRMLAEDGDCLVGWLATTTMESSHQASRRCMAAHSSGAGQLSCQLSAMGMLLRAITSLRLARPKHGDVLFKALLRSQKRAKKEEALKVGSVSCLEAAWAWTKRCDETGLDGDIVESSEGTCTFTPTTSVCVAGADAANVINWATGTEACKDYDATEYPPKASYRCLYDVRRKPLPTAAATAAATAAFAPVPPIPGAAGAASTPAAAAAATPPTAPAPVPATDRDADGGGGDADGGADGSDGLDADMLAPPDQSFVSLPSDEDIDLMYSQAAGADDANDPRCISGNEEAMREELAELEAEVIEQLDLLESEIVDGVSDDKVVGMPVDDDGARMDDNEE